jgi:two-component sensor histidine kinase
LIEEELAPYSRAGSQVRIEGSNVLLAQDAAQTIAVAIHELATNAAKYGSLSREEGRVDVAWSRTEDGRLVIRWIETGGPHVYTPSHRGFGTRVIDNMIRGLKGGASFNWRPEGLECRIAIPLSENDV